jgi:hypothetical protein
LSGTEPFGVCHWLVPVTEGLLEVIGPDGVLQRRGFLHVLRACQYYANPPPRAAQSLRQSIASLSDAGAHQRTEANLWNLATAGGSLDASTDEIDSAVLDLWSSELIHMTVIDVGKDNGVNGMGQSVPFKSTDGIRGESSDSRIAACLETLNLFEQGLACIKVMTNDERDLLMKLLSCWSLSGRFGSEVNSAVVGLQKYCSAKCELEDPHWEAPKYVRRDFARLT